MKKYISLLAFLLIMLNGLRATPEIRIDGICNDPNNPHYGMCHWSVWEGDVCLWAGWSDCDIHASSGEIIGITPGMFYDFSNEPVIKQGIEAYNRNLAVTKSKKAKIDLKHLKYVNRGFVIPKDKPIPIHKGN